MGKTSFDRCKSCGSTDRSESVRLCAICERTELQGYGTPCATVDVKVWGVEGALSIYGRPASTHMKPAEAHLQVCLPCAERIGIISSSPASGPHAGVPGDWCQCGHTAAAHTIDLNTNSVDCARCDCHHYRRYEAPASTEGGER